MGVGPDGGGSRVVEGLETGVNMTVVKDVRQYDAAGNLVYKNYVTLIDGNYNVDVIDFRGGVMAIPTDNGTGNDTIHIVTSGAPPEIMALWSGDDYLFLEAGEEGRSLIQGDDGNDTIIVLANSTVDGGRGDDTLYSRGEVWGGSGNDTVRSGIIAHGGDGDDHVYSAGIAYGDEGNDYVEGDSGVYGGSGADILVITGTGDGAVLDGGAGDDWLHGGTGKDILIGGQGGDHLIGGSGADIFRFEKADLGFMYGSRDQIHDFELGQDKIDLTALAGAAITLSHSEAYDRVKIDLNGDQKTDLMIQVHLVGGGALTMDDILIA